jgi:DNA-directed RNA polymerase subunit M/transcription elongation factor TFIIS
MVNIQKGQVFIRAKHAVTNEWAALDLLDSTECSDETFRKFIMNKVIEITEALLDEKHEKGIRPIVYLKEPTKEDVKGSKEDPLPYLALGAEELAELPESGSKTLCPKCKKENEIDYNVSKDSAFNMGFITCCGNTWLVAVNKKLLKQK